MEVSILYIQIINNNIPKYVRFSIIAKQNDQIIFWCDKKGAHTFVDCMKNTILQMFMRNKNNRYNNFKNKLQSVVEYAIEIVNGIWERTTNIYMCARIDIIWHIHTPHHNDHHHHHHYNHWRFQICCGVVCIWIICEFPRFHELFACVNRVRTLNKSSSRSSSVASSIAWLW